MTKASTMPLARAAARLASDRRFMASALAATNGGEWNETAVTDRLQCSIESAINLSLCFRPSGSSASFRVEVQRIAEFIGVSAGEIAALIREAEAIEVLRGDSSTEFLAAARDRLSQRDDDEGKE